MPIKARGWQQRNSPASPSDELRLKVEALSDAVAARDNFIAIAAHELRNPMTPMIGHIELLLRGLKAGRFDHQQVEQRLELVHAAMTRYRKRAETLLDVSRITTGKLKLDPVTCDVAAMARDVASTFAVAARHAGATIVVRGPESLLGRWDQLALEQILDNLVSNAVKYGGPHEVSIEIASLGERVRIRVSDRGPGITPENRDRIFGRFERAVRFSEQAPGFGIGLWVVGQLVEAMGGTIAVDGAEGGGAVFEVQLPNNRATVQ